MQVSCQSGVLAKLLCFFKNPEAVNNTVMTFRGQCAPIWSQVRGTQTRTLLEFRELRLLLLARYLHYLETRLRRPVGGGDMGRMRCVLAGRSPVAPKPHASHAPPVALNPRTNSGGMRYEDSV